MSIKKIIKLANNFEEKLTEHSEAFVDKTKLTDGVKLIILRNLHSNLLSFDKQLFQLLNQEQDESNLEKVKLIIKSYLELENSIKEYFRHLNK